MFMDTFTWRRIVSFGNEGTEAGNFCRPWGVAITRYSGHSSNITATINSPWLYEDQFRSDANKQAINVSSSNNHHLQTFNNGPAQLLGLGFGTEFMLNDDDNHLSNIFGRNNGIINSNSINSSSSSSAASYAPPNLSTYLIAVADRSNNRVQVFKFDALQKQVTFLHMFGDGPGARHGQFDRPAGIVFNSELEQILVADKDNHRVQVFDLTGSYLYKFGERGSKCGQFCYPWDIDVCKTTHNIIVSDTRNRRIQMFSSLGRYVTHFNQPLDSPRGVVYLSPHQMLVSDFNKHRLVLITQNDDKQQVTSSTSMICGINNNNSNKNNIGSNINISNNNGTSYLSNNYNNFSNLLATQQINNNNNNNNKAITRSQITSHPPAIHESKFIGFGEGSSWGEFLRPQGATTNGSSVFCSDSRNNRVACWNKDTQSFSYISKDVVELDRPAGLAAIDNFIVIVDFGNNRIHICQYVMFMDSYTWRRVVSFGTEGTEAGNFCRPWGVAITRYSGHSGDTTSSSSPWFYNDQFRTETSKATTINVSSSINHQHTFNSNNNNNNNNRPVQLGVGFGNDFMMNEDKLSNIFGNNNTINNDSINSPNSSTYLIAVADRSNNRVQVFKFDALQKQVTFLRMFGDGPGARHGQFDRPAGIVFNSELEQILVADKDNHRVQVFDLTGSYLYKFGERGSKCGQFCYPWDIDVCKTTHNIIVSDTRNRRIQMFNSLGRYLTHFNQPLDSPRGVVFLSPQQILVSDFNKHRLVLIAQNDDKQQVTSSTSIISSTGNNNNTIINGTNYLTNTFNNHHLSTAQKAISRSHNHHQQQQQQQQQITSTQIPLPLHESKFIGFGEGSSWGEFLRPQGATTNGSSVFCSDSRNNRVACWNKDTQSFSYISKDVVELDRPAGLAAIDNFIVIVDFGNNRIHICQYTNTTSTGMQAF